jgi:chromosome segregation ATPase
MSVAGLWIAWRKQARLWTWGMAAGALFVSAGLMLQLWRVDKRFERDRRVAAMQVQEAVDRKASLAADLGSYEDLLQRYNNQKQQLIREIGEFGKQLDLLKARTQGLERAHSGLQELERALTGFRSAQERFESNLRTLEQAVQKSASRQ